MDKKKKNKNEKNSSKSVDKDGIPLKITNNINIIYDDEVIQDLVSDLRGFFGIKGKLHDSVIKEISKIKNIDKLVEHLTKSWIDQVFKNKEFGRTLGKKIMKKALLRTGEDKGLSKKEFDEIIEHVSREETGIYLRHELSRYPRSDLFLLFSIRINLNIWRQVLDARILGASEKNVLNCKQSIYKKYYLPSVVSYSDSLHIIINELTIQEDVLDIWKIVEKEQEEYKAKFKYINSERTGDNLKLDRIIWNLYEQNKKPKAIAIELKGKGYKGYEPKKVSERLKEIKKRIRWKKKNMRF